jgi:hypothetical protein
MTTKTIVGTYPGGYTLKAAYSGLEIASRATVGGDGVLLTQTGLVTNYGVVIANSGTHAGVDLQNGGAVVNASEISGYYGIVTQCNNPLDPVWSSIVNHGYTGGQRAGVQINEFGELSNYGTVHGGNYGVEDNVANTGVTIRNYGYITGISGVFLSSGGTRLYNGSATDTLALIKGVFGVTTDGPESYVTNDGTISGQSYAVSLLSSSTLTNGGAAHLGLIEGARAVNATGANAMVSNFAAIMGGNGAGDFGVRLSDGGVLTNGVDGTISGYAGVLVGLASSPTGGTVTNTGVIEGTGLYGGYGVAFRKGGEVFNGTATTGQSGEITGYEAVSILGGAGYVHNDGFIGSNGPGAAGVYLASGTFINGDGYGQVLGVTGVAIGAGTVSNLGGIQGSVAFGVVIGGAGDVVNGAAKAADEHAQIQGYADGVVCNATLTLSNFATIISSHGQGVYAYGGGSVTNGAANDKTALITGVGGVLGKNATGTVKNFGTISGTASSGYGVDLISGGRLTNGATTDTGASISGNGGVKLGATGTVINFATITGSGVPGGGYGAVLESGGNLTNGSSGDANALIGGFGGVIVYGADKVTNFGTLGDGVGSAVLFEATGGTLAVEAGSTFDGAVDGDGGALELASGDGAIVLAGHDITASGSMPTTAFTDFDTVRIEAGASFEVSGDNTGLLWVVGGTLTSDGAVSGTGRVDIDGGVADLGAGFEEAVDFDGTTGELALGGSKTYTGEITGFSLAGKTSLDLLDIAFAENTTAVYSGTATSGVLTVTEGSNTAEIKLKGDYLSSTFTLSAAAGGGTLVVDPPKAAATASYPSGSAAPHPFIAAMAGFGGASGAPRELPENEPPARLFALAAPATA